MSCLSIPRGSLLFSLLPIFLFLSSTFFSFSFGGETHFPTSQKIPISGNFFSYYHKNQIFSFVFSASEILLFLKLDFLDVEISGAFGQENYGVVVSWRTERFLAENSSPTGSSDEEEAPLNSSYLILAAKRTHRKDPLDGFNKYSGGWNIRNEHYWAVSL